MKTLISAIVFLTLSQAAFASCENEERAAMEADYAYSQETRVLGTLNQLTDEVKNRSRNLAGARELTERERQRFEAENQDKATQLRSIQNRLHELAEAASAAELNLKMCRENNQDNSTQIPADGQHVQNETQGE